MSMCTCTPRAARTHNDCKMLCAPTCKREIVPRTSQKTAPRDPIGHLLLLPLEGVQGFDFGHMPDCHLFCKNHLPRTPPLENLGAATNY